VEPEFSDEGDIFSQRYLGKRFFLRNYKIVKQFKNFMRNFSGVNGPAEIVSAGSMTPLKSSLIGFRGSLTPLKCI
jgi:hypothetical protein